MPQARDEAGNIWETDAQGNPVRLLQAAGPQMPADPAFPYQGPKAAAEVTGSALENRITEATLPDVIRKTKAVADKAEADAQAAAATAARGPEPSATEVEQAAKTEGQRRKAQVVRQIMGEVRSLYDKSIKGQPRERLFGLTERIDSIPANEEFRIAAENILPLIRPMIAQSAKEGDSDREMQIFQSYIPHNDDSDRTIERKLKQLEMLIGGLVDGAPPSQTLASPERQNALTTPRIIDESGLGAAPAGSTTSLEQLPPAYQQAYEAFARAGGYTPEQYADFRASLDRQFFPEAGDQRATYIEEGRRILDTLEKGGTLNLTVPGVERDLSNEGLFGTSAFSEQARNNAVNNPVGAAVAGGADMGSFGALSAFDPNAMAALSEAEPEGTMFGQAVGAIGGTGGLGAATRFLANRVPTASRLLGGGAGAQVARSVATDAGYSGIYGANTDQNPLTAAAFGAGGSLLGQGAGSVVGRGVSGVTSSPTVSRLYQQGVVPTIGQIARGRAADSGGRSIVAGAEDVLANNGAFGTLVNSARARALEQGNQAAFNIGGMGRPITGIGEQGLEQLDTSVENAFGDALGGVRLDPRNPQFIGDVTAADTAGRAVDAARGRGDFGYIMDNQLGPIFSGPEITGEQLQDALRLLRGQSRAYQRAATGVQPDPMAGGVADAANEVVGALTDLAGNTDPTIVPRLNEANQMYRNLLVLDDAAARGMNEGGVFTGAQLGQAIKANNRGLGRRGLRAASESPFYQLQQDMQTVLPNQVPPTGVNAAPMLAMLGAASSAGGFATDNDYLKYAGLAGAAALPYTRAGQRAAASALLGRSPRAVAIGNAIRNRRGLFGSASLPLLITE